MFGAATKLPDSSDDFDPRHQARPFEWPVDPRQPAPRIAVANGHRL